jgi:hypothetical protein
MTMPSAPPSSTLVATQCSIHGTRTSGVIPASSAATDICAAVSMEIGLCSRSMNSQS